MFVEHRISFFPKSRYLFSVRILEGGFAARFKSLLTVKNYLRKIYCTFKCFHNLPSKQLLHHAYIWQYSESKFELFLLLFFGSSSKRTQLSKWQIALRKGKSKECTFPEIQAVFFFLHVLVKTINAVINKNDTIINIAKKIHGHVTGIEKF